MKWRNHKLVTFCTVFSITGGFVAAAAAMIGSVLPDVLEFRGRIQHRTLTHYIWAWLFSSLFFWVLLWKQEFLSMPLYCVFFLFAGGLMHICQDALSSGGIPVFTPYGVRKGLNIYRTRTLSEEITVFGLLAIFTGFAWVRGYLTMDYVSEQFDVVMRVLIRSLRI